MAPELNNRLGDGAEQFASYMYGLEMHSGQATQDLAGGMPTNFEDSTPLPSDHHHHQFMNSAHDTVEGIIFENIRISQVTNGMHSVAIPISGRRSPIYNPTVSKYVPTAASAGSKGLAARLGGMAIFTDMAVKNPSGLYFGAEPGVPMPSPIMANPSNSKGEGIQNPMYFHYAQSLPTAEDRPASPPTSRSFVGGKTPSMGASPRSLNESMFSFRAGSLSTAEQQVEKQKRRKENHNAVERRRRDLINNMISQLALVVSATPSGLEPSIASKMNKGEVLESSVRRLFLLNQAVSELSEQLASIDRDNIVLRKYADLISVLVTQLPETDGPSTLMYHESIE